MMNIKKDFIKFLSVNIFMISMVFLKPNDNSDHQQSIYECVVHFKVGQSDLSSSNKDSHLEANLYLDDYMRPVLSQNIESDKLESLIKEKFLDYLSEPKNRSAELVNYSFVVNDDMLQLIFPISLCENNFNNFQVSFNNGRIDITHSLCVGPSNIELKVFYSFKVPANLNLNVSSYQVKSSANNFVVFEFPIVKSPDLSSGNSTSLESMAHDESDSDLVVLGVLFKHLN